MKKLSGITENTERGSKMKKLLGTAVAVMGLVLACGCVQEPTAELSDSENIQNLLSSNDYVRMSPLEGQGESGGGGKDNELPEEMRKILRKTHREYDMKIIDLND